MKFMRTNRILINYNSKAFAFCFVLFELFFSAHAFDFSELMNDDWQKCANERQICKFDGTRIIRFGNANKWNFSVAKNNIECSNRIFGDPNPGIAKFCEVGKITTREIKGSQIKIAPIFYIFKDFEKSNLPSSDDVKQLTYYLMEAR